MTVVALSASQNIHPALRRLAAMVGIGESDHVALRYAVARERSIKPRDELLQEGNLSASGYSSFRAGPLKSASS